jgi:hypothetical protein
MSDDTTQDTVVDPAVASAEASSDVTVTETPEPATGTSDVIEAALAAVARTKSGRVIKRTVTNADGGEFDVVEDPDGSEHVEDRPEEHTNITPTQGAPVGAGYPIGIFVGFGVEECGVGDLGMFRVDPTSGEITGPL